MFPYKAPGIKLFQSPAVTSHHITDFGCGVFCSSSGTLWQLGPDLHRFHGWSCAGAPSWRRAELSCLAAACWGQTP